MQCKGKGLQLQPTHRKEYGKLHVGTTRQRRHQKAAAASVAAGTIGSKCRVHNHMVRSNVCCFLL